jgi:hypothetical protein
MKLIAACLSLAIVAMTAALVPLEAARERSEPVAHVDILVGGAVMPIYAQSGRLYVEALRGREYEIRVRNPYPVRVAVALSVDGLNTIDARHTTATDARKWVINPYDSITIRGWQTSQVQARHFEFTTEVASYGHALGRTANLGVISAVIFRERGSAPALETLDPAVPRPLAPTPDASAPAPPAEGSRDSASNRTEERAFDGARRQRDDYAATGMGRPTEHLVRAIHLDLEDTPVHTVDIRYEFRPQLVRLGILPRETAIDRMRQRDRARGFEPEFSPIPSGR